MSVMDELRALRNLLESLKSGQMSIRQNGKDVTQREIKNLEPDIRYLESAVVTE